MMFKTRLCDTYRSKQKITKLSLYFIVLSVFHFKISVNISLNAHILLNDRFLSISK